MSREAAHASRLRQDRWTALDEAWQASWRSAIQRLEEALVVGERTRVVSLVLDSFFFPFISAK